MPACEVAAREASLSLAHFTSAGLIIPCLHGQDATAVMQELGLALQREGYVPDLLPFYQAALNREFLCSTVADPGWAVPHAQVKGLLKPCFALGRSPLPVAWPTEKRWVQLVFLLAIPECDTGSYMTLIMGMGRLGRDRHLLQMLLKAGDTFEMFNVLRQVPLPTKPAV